MNKLQNRLLQMGFGSSEQVAQMLRGRDFDPVPRRETSKNTPASAFSAHDQQACYFCQFSYFRHQAIVTRSYYICEPETGFCIMRSRVLEKPHAGNPVAFVNFWSSSAARRTVSLLGSSIVIRSIANTPVG